jgi:hypothetical protein
MNTGDSVTDGQERIWQVGQALGRGLWGSSWVVRNEENRELVLKVAHSKEDFPSDAPVPEELADACASCLREQAKLLSESHAFLPKLESSFELDDGRSAMLIPRYSTTLERRLDAGLPLGETLALVGRVATLLEALGRAGHVHGNLRPSNVLLNERAEPVLADLLTPAAHEWWGRMQKLALDRRDYTPPEATGTPRAGWDTWAMCLAIYQSAMSVPETDPRREELLELPRKGLSKIQLATLRDRALARLKAEGANPRFASRVAERLGSLLNRGISAELEPSPPYRFHAASELRPRVIELAALVRPQVESVGKLLLSAAAKETVFQGGDDVAFSVTIGATDGVTDHEHIACGVQIHDLDADEESRVPVPEARYTVQTHPSGRMRFGFDIPDLPPGRYRARVAFTVKDSGDEPKIAEGEFEVRPPPGYVPPAEDLAPSAPEPIALDERRREREQDAEVAPAADVFPTPIAPSSAESDLDIDPSSGDVSPIPVQVEHVPTMADLPSMDAPPAPQDGDTPRAPPIAVVPDGPTPVSPAPRAYAGPGSWEDELPGPGDDLADADSEPWVPGPAQGEDLPEWDDAAPEKGALDISTLLKRAAEIARRDAYAVFLVGLAGVLGVLFVAMLILKAILF